MIGFWCRLYVALPARIIGRVKGADLRACFIAFFVLHLAGGAKKHRVPAGCLYGCVLRSLVS